MLNEKSHFLTFSAKKPRNKKHPSKPQPPKVALPFTLKQNACAALNTTGIKANDKAIIDFPHCTTITIYQAFNSTEAQAVWNSILQDNPTFSMPPADPAKSGLLVIKNAAGKVEILAPFNMGLQFSLSNAIIQGGSEYFLASHAKDGAFPILYMNLLSPVTAVVIPGNIYGGPGKDCINMGFQPDATSALYAKDFITQEKRITPR